MKKTDWDKLHVGATIHLPRGNFYVSTVELLGTEKRPKGIGEIWDRYGNRLTKDSKIMAQLFSMRSNNWTPCPSALPVIDNAVVFPGNPKWPEATTCWFRGWRGDHSYSQEELDK